MSEIETPESRLQRINEHEQRNQRLSSPDQRFQERLARNLSAEALQRRIIEQETTNLSIALERITDTGVLPRAASLIVAARRRYVSGAAKSFGYAALLSGDLAVGLSHVTLIDDSIVHTLDVLSEVRDSDVLVAFSFRRYRRSTLSLAEQFVAAGGKVIAITDHADSPVVALAAEAVIVSTDSVSFADSPTAVAAVTHILTTLSTASAKGARRRIAVREQFGQALGIYI